MILPGADLFDPRSDMDSYVSPVESRLDYDFSFAFNDSNFSDRVLKIEIVAGLPDVKSAGDGCSGITEWARNRKRRREDVKKDKAVEIVGQSEDEQALTCNIPDTEDTVAYENQDVEAVAMVEGSPTDAQLDFHQRGDAAGPSSDSSWSMDCSTVLRVKSVHISSAILAAKSLFFHELFLNGIKDSAQRDVTIQIHASEEEALMDLLNFMYSNNLSASRATALLDVLLAADKFKVASCMRYCSKLLRNIPMTCESALLYLDLPSSILMAEAAQPLTDAAKKFLSVRYKDIYKFQEEVLGLPLAGIEAVLSSDYLQAASEDTIYDLVLKWAHTHYPKLEERKEVLAKQLVQLIRFPYMTCRKLKKVVGPSSNRYHSYFCSEDMTQMRHAFALLLFSLLLLSQSLPGSAVGRQLDKALTKSQLPALTKSQLPEGRQNDVISSLQARKLGVYIRKKARVYPRSGRKSSAIRTQVPSSHVIGSVFAFLSFFLL